MKRIQLDALKAVRQLDSSFEYREREFYVVFTESDKHVWTPFLKEGFTHCYVIEKLEFIWMMMDPTRYGLNIILPPCDSNHPLPEMMMQLDEKLTVLHIITKGDGSSLVMKPKLLTCVSVVEYILGVSFNFAVTPYRLYKKLKLCKHSNLISVEELICQ